MEKMHAPRAISRPAIPALALCALALLAGCRARGLLFSNAQAPRPFEAPQWVFQEHGPGKYRGEEVIIAVGVDSQALDHQSRRENALADARRRIETELLAAAKQLAEDVTGRMDAPGRISDAVREILEQKAAEAASKLALEAEPVSTYDAMLRRESFVKLVVTLDRLAAHYGAAARAGLQDFLKDAVGPRESETILEDFDRALQASI